MRVQFMCNLGSRDAEPLGLDHRECTYEAVVDVPDDSAKWLLEHGVAHDPVPEPKRKPGDPPSMQGKPGDHGKLGEHGTPGEDEPHHKDDPHHKDHGKK